MKKHKGEIFEGVINRFCEIRGISKTALAKKAGYDQSSFYRHKERDDLPNYIILRYGRAMKYDFRKEFPELEDDWELISDEDKVISPDGELAHDCQEKIEYWKNKYTDLLERHNELLMECIKNKN